MVLLLLEENDLKEYVEDVVHILTNLVDLAFHKKREVKTRWLLLESMKDHLIPHIVEKTSAKEMYDDIIGLYKNGNIDRKFHLKHQLQGVNMSSDDMVANYLMKIT
jgi:hypothetical protein